MNHDKWDDDKIEELLSKVPKIHDHRSKDDVLNRLKDEGIFNEEPVPTKQKKKINWLPFVITAAAIVLLAIVGPSFIKQMANNSEESIGIESKESSNDQSELMDTRMAEESMSMLASDTTANLSTVVYPEELEGKTVFQLGLASDAADSVPVTVLIPNERILEDFGKTVPTGVELYNKYASQFNEGAIGFVDYHPYVGEITEQGSQVILTLPRKHPYDMASATSETFKASLFDTFHYYYDQIVLRNEDGSAFVFSQEGVPSKPIQLQSNPHFNYFRQTQANGSQYLTPNFRMTYETVEEALKAMKEETNDIYKSVIVPGVEYNVSVNGEIVEVTFTEPIDLMNYDQIDAMQMIEGMLLTAAGFNMEIQFNNLVQTEWQGLNFTKPLPMPVAPNEIPYEVVLQ